MNKVFTTIVTSIIIISMLAPSISLAADPLKSAKVALFQTVEGRRFFEDVRARLGEWGEIRTKKLIRKLKKAASKVEAKIQDLDGESFEGLKRKSLESLGLEESDDSELENTSMMIAELFEESSRKEDRELTSVIGQLKNVSKDQTIQIAHYVRTQAIRLLEKPKNLLSDDTTTTIIIIAMMTGSLLLITGTVVALGVLGFLLLPVELLGIFVAYIVLFPPTH